MLNKYLHSLVFVALLGLLGSSLACGNDPYSRRRIQSRTEHMQKTADDYAKHDAEGSERLKQRQRDLDRWWKSDEKATRKNIRELGDYVW